MTTQGTYPLREVLERLRPLAEIVPRFESEVEKAEAQIALAREVWSAAQESHAQAEALHAEQMRAAEEAFSCALSEAGLSDFVVRHRESEGIDTLVTDGTPHPPALPASASLLELAGEEKYRNHLPETTNENGGGDSQAGEPVSGALLSPIAVLTETADEATEEEPLLPQEAQQLLPVEITQEAASLTHCATCPFPLTSTEKALGKMVCGVCERKAFENAQMESRAVTYSASGASAPGTVISSASTRTSAATDTPATVSTEAGACRGCGKAFSPAQVRTGLKNCARCAAKAREAKERANPAPVEAVTPAEVAERPEPGKCLDCKTPLRKTGALRCKTCSNKFKNGGKRVQASPPGSATGKRGRQCACGNRIWSTTAERCKRCGQRQRADRRKEQEIGVGRAPADVTVAPITPATPTTTEPVAATAAAVFAPFEQPSELPPAIVIRPNVRRMPTPGKSIEDLFKDEDDGDPAPMPAPEGGIKDYLASVAMANRMDPGERASLNAEIHQGLIRHSPRRFDVHQDAIGNYYCVAVYTKPQEGCRAILRIEYFENRPFPKFFTEKVGV